MNTMKAKKLGTGNVFLRGVVIFDQHATGTTNQFNGNTEYNVGIKIMNNDDLSNKSLVDFIKMMGLNQTDINNIFMRDDEGITFFSKSRKAISVLDIENQIVNIDSLIGFKVVVALNVTIWQYGNTRNVGAYCNGLKVLEKAETKTIFDVFSTSQSQMYIEDTKKQQLNNEVQKQIGDLNEYEDIISDNVPF